ncbi:MAG TPA: CPBP family intramembrane glutamic endopeptidase [Candidatus Dormibacteraeota bacterium]
MDPQPVSRTPRQTTSWRWPLIGTIIAIAVSAFMDLIGISNFNVLPLIPLFFVLWYLQHLSRVEIGLTWGQLRDYALAVLYPLLALALIGLIAWLSGAATFGRINWASTVGNLVLQLVLTIAFAIVTEEGIFRGWLWASLQRAGVSEVRVIALTAVAFAAWHLPDVLLPTDFRPPAAQAPVYILNVVAIGIIWGLMRKWSGSIVVTSVSHGVWNAFTYVLFGVGATTGALGIHNTALFGPEVGLVGLGVNVALAAVLWLGSNRGRAVQAMGMTGP